MNFLRKKDSFQEFHFEPDEINQSSPHDWRKARFNKKDADDEQKKEQKAVLQLFTATSSSAAVEHVFSTYGLVQSSLQNRLGNDRASKLVFLFKLLDKNDS